jgi:hypothetical protein
MPRFFADLAERAVLTYVEAFLGLLLATGFNLADLSALNAAAIAAIPAALVVVKAGIGTLIGDSATASWLPKAKQSGPAGV